MKKKIISLILTASAVMSVTAFAETINAANRNGLEFSQPSETKAILMCYDNNGTLVYSGLYKSDDGSFKANVPAQYENTKKKLYFVDTKKFMNISESEAPDMTASPAPTNTPSETDKPSETAAPQPTKTPSSSASKYPSIYEKAVDAIYAPALVTDVETRVNGDNENIYAVKVFQHGKEAVIGIEADLAISTASEEYSYMRGQNVGSLQKGDVICLTANVSGDTVRTVDFIFRPTDTDIVTGTADYGTNFEKLFVSDGKVAGKWSFMKYGEKPSSEKYKYAFGIIGQKTGGTLMLINKEGSEDKGIEVDIQEDTIVYTCDVSAKDYEPEIGDIGDIQTTIPRSAFAETGTAELNGDYSYNYALVRTVNGTATDMVLYNNYND